MKRVLILALLLAAASLGCSTRGAEPASTSSAADAGAAPTARSPLAVAGLSARPCELLGAGELAELELELPGRQRRTVGAEECRWASGRGEDLGLVPDGRRNLLTEAYRAPWRGVSAPGTVGGYPSLQRKTGSGDLNICTVIVGLGPGSSLTADWIGTGPPGGVRDACAMAERAAASAIGKLPGG